LIHEFQIPIEKANLLQRFPGKNIFLVPDRPIGFRYLRSQDGQNAISEAAHPPAEQVPRGSTQ
jgi:hypothetical protein